MVHRGFRPLSIFPVLVFLTVQCAPLVMICVRELGVAGYTKFVRIDCGELRCEFGLFLYRPGYFNVVRDGSCVSCVPAPSCARSRNRSSPALVLVCNPPLLRSRYRYLLSLSHGYLYTLDCQVKQTMTCDRPRCRFIN